MINLFLGTVTWGLSGQWAVLCYQHTWCQSSCFARSFYRTNWWGRCLHLLFANFASSILQLCSGHNLYGLSDKNWRGGPESMHHSGSCAKTNRNRKYQQKYHFRSAAIMPMGGSIWPSWPYFGLFASFQQPSGEFFCHFCSFLALTDDFWPLIMYVFRW